MNSKEKYPNLTRINPKTCISGRIMQCNRIVANIFRKHLIQHDITDSQLSILFVIGKTNGVNQKSISDFLFLEKSTVNRNLKRLLDKDYIKVENKFDYKPTQLGHRFLEKVIPSWENAMSEISNLLGENGIESLDIIHNILTHK